MNAKLLTRIMILLVILTCALYGTGAAESYSAITMRLLRYSGTVEIEDASGKPRFIMENARFNSGESMKTGPESYAAVSLDSSKILTLDAESRVEFAKNANSLVMKLTQGSLLLDVQEKLNENESLDIQTSTMVVGIRGTIVFVSVGEDPEQSALAEGAPSGQLTEVLNAKQSAGGQITTLGVLEGVAQLSYRDDSGTQRRLDVSAGQKATLIDPDEDGLIEAAPALTDMTAADLPAYVNAEIEADEALRNRVNDASPVLINTGEPAQQENPYAADGDWQWNGTVTLVAQSASKLYDGQPLTRPSDVLVYGLPADFGIRVSANGSQTDAGTGVNHIAGYAIYNAQGENVTAHFPHIDKVDGRLTVDPAPLTAWTASAAKEYDGTPLTEPDAKLITYPGYERNAPRWRNASYVVTEAAGSQTLYGVSGVIWTHGTNPLTGETRELQLYAGQKLSVLLSNADGEQSIEFRIDNITEAEIPEDLLRLYAANPGLLAQACADTGWNEDVIRGRIGALTAVSQATAVKDDLRIDEAAADRLMLNSTNVRITIDTDVTNYNGRALNGEEAHYTPVRLDENITITATGAQTPVGESLNTYEIQWGGVDPNNYVISEELGALTVTPNTAHITLTPASAKKTYDGKALKRSTVIVKGVPDGFTCEAKAEGSRKDAGSTNNTVGSYAIYNADGEDVTAFFSNIDTRIGHLTVSKAPLNVVTSSASKGYDGTPLTSPEAEIDGLVNKEKATVTATGSITGVGTTENTYSIDWDTAKKNNYTITEELGLLEIIAYDTPITVTSGDGSMRYRPWDCVVTNSEYTVEGLPDGFSLTANITGEQAWEVGSSPNTIESYTISDSAGKDVTAYFTNVTLVPGTLTINKAILEIWSDNVAKVYDGYPAVSTIHWTGIYGMDNAQHGVSITHASSQTDVGTSDDSFNVYWNYPELEGLYEIQTRPGKLTVTPAEITVTTGSAEKTYDGTALTNAVASVKGGVYGQPIEVTVTGSITDAGEAVNTYTIDWGSYAKSSNYTVTEVLGTLKVTPATVTVKTGSAAKAYDGTALTSDEASITGLAGADTGKVTVTATGTIAEVGTTDNTYDISWGSASQANYTLAEDLGKLTVTANDTPITLTASSETKVFDGTALTATVTASGLPTGFTCTAEAGGGQTNVGSSESTVAGYTITHTASGKDATANFTNITTVNGTLSVTPLSLEVYVEGSYKYDGNTHYGTAKVNGAPRTITQQNEKTWRVQFPWGDVLSVQSSGGYSNVGVFSSGAELSMVSGSMDNYIFHMPGSDIIINPNDTAITFTAGSASRQYDGTALSTTEYTVTGLPAGFTHSATVTGFRTAAGTEDSIISAYHIYDRNGDNVATNFSNVSTVKGTLTVTPRALTITSGSATKAYDGTALTNPEYTVDGLAGSDGINVAVTGSLTAVGSAENSFAYTLEPDPANYTITTKPGTLTVTSNTAAITLTAGSAGKTYDGTPLTAGDVSVSGLPGGFTCSASASGSQTDAGTSANTVSSYTILDSSSNNVTAYFSNIRTVDGELTVSRASATVTTGSAVMPYDGSELTNATATITGLVNGETATVTATGKITSIGKVKNTYSITWGTAKPGNYTLTENLGELEVYDPDPDTSEPPSTEEP